ncbi:MAG: protein translocase subunit SecF [Proteobacteria bacterium]|nr:protein translocase subunit SecF [Pseudomonadota bacterium]
MGRSRFFGTISIVMVLTSLVLLFTLQPRWGIDFLGGTEIQVKFKNAVAPSEIRAVLQQKGFEGFEVVSFGAGDAEFLIRLREISTLDESALEAIEMTFRSEVKGATIKRFFTSPGGDKLTVHLDGELSIAEVEKSARAAGLNLLDSVDHVVADEPTVNPVDEDGDAQETQRKCESASCTWVSQGVHVYEVALKGISEDVMDNLRAQPFGEGAIKMRSEWVGPKVGEQLRSSAISAVLFAMLFIMLYVALRFDLRFAPGGVVALLHDIMITLGIFVILRIEITLATVAALLTIVGYSINDTIVIYDRIRENLVKIKGQQLSRVINTSINETLSRTVVTSLTTLFATVTLMIVGWNTSLRDFSLALTIGVLVGSYSSIVIASPLAHWLDKTFFTKKA